jgi:hypothetical protein
VDEGTEDDAVAQQRSEKMHLIEIKSGPLTVGLAARRVQVS